MADGVVGSEIYNFPKMYLVGGNGSGAFAYVKSLTSGTITSSDISVGNGGTGYTVAPTVYIASPSSGLTGDFSLQVYYTAAPPTNDEPSGAKVLTVGTSCVPSYANESGINATTTTVPATTCTGINDDDIWYKYTATVTQKLAFTATPTVSASFVNLVLQAYDAGVADDITTATSLGCFNTTGTGFAESGSINMVAGKTYYLRVYHAGSGNGKANAKFSICAYTINPLGYEFTQGTGGYTPLSAGTTLFSGTFDIGNVAVNLGANPVELNGVSYSTVNVSTDGYITLDAASVGVTTPISSVGKAVVAPGAANLINAASGSPTVSWGVVGNEVVFEWKDVSLSPATTYTGQIYNFQARYNKVSKTWQFAYGNCTNGASTGSMQVGLRAENSNAIPGFVMNRTGVWSQTLSTTSAFSTVTVSAASTPVLGTTFNWTTTPCQSYPATLSASPVYGDSARVIFNQMLTATAGYDIRYRKLTDPNTVSSWVSPVSTTASVTDTTIWLTGLSASTAYVFEVRGNCGASKTYFGSARQFTTTAPNFDVKPTATASLSSCPNGATPVVIRIQNAGTKVIIAGTMIPVTVRLGGPNGLQNQSTTATLGANLAVGSSTTIAVGSFNLSTAGKYPVLRAYTTWSGDGRVTNDTLALGDTINVSPSYTSGYAYGFEDGTAPDYTRVPAAGGSYTWEIRTTGNDAGNLNTPQSGTKMAYFDGLGQFGDLYGNLFTPCFDITDNCSVLKFFHSQDQRTTDPADGTTVFVTIDNGVTYTQLTLRNINKRVNVTSILRSDPSLTAPRWTEFSADLSPFIGKTVKFLFQGHSASGGTNWGLDNIRITSRPAADVGVQYVQSPEASPGCASATAPVTVVIKNLGCAPQSNFDIDVRITGAISQSYSYTYTGTLASGATDVVNVGTVNLTTLGTYRTQTFTTLPGDGDLTNDTSLSITTITNSNRPPVITATATPSSIITGSSTTLAATGPTVGPAGITNSTNYSIDDSFSDTTRSNIVVSGVTGSANSITGITINIDHPFDADLDIYLKAPDGSRVELSTDNGSFGANYSGTIFDPTAATLITSGSVPFTGRFRPEGNISALTGGINGTWQLMVVDDYPDNLSFGPGTLLNWSLEVTAPTTNQWTLVSGPATVAGIPFSGQNAGSKTLTTAGTYQFQYVSAYATGCSATLNVPVIVSDGNVWKGIDNTVPSNNWNTAGNWAFSPSPPMAGTAVVIPDSAPNAPTISSAVQVTNITFSGTGTGTTRMITVNSGGSIDVKGNITGQGTVQGAGAISFSGTGAQQINGYVNVGSFTLSNTNLTGLTTIGAGSTLRILPGGTLTMGANAKLTVPSDGRMILASDATGTARLGVMPSTATINGNLTLERYVAGSTPGWYFLGAPFKAGTANLTEWNELPARVSPKNNANVFEYTEPDTTRGTYNGRLTEFAGWKVPSAVTNTFNPGNSPKGYRGYLNPNFFGNLGKTISASGNPITQNVSANYTKTLTGFEGGGWNLLANPYPSEIDWNAVRFDASNASGTMGSAINIYQGSTANYGTYTAITPTTGIAVGNASRYIASSQAFFIKATAGGSLTFKEAHKNAGNANTFTRNAADDDLIRFKLVQGNSFDEAAIAFMDGASRGHDAWDADNPGGSVVDVASTPVPGLNLAINLMPVLNTETTIPLMTSVPNTGQAELRFTGVSSFPNGTHIYLRDNFTGMLQDLTLTPNYTYTITTDPLSRDMARMELVFNPASVTATKAVAAQMRLGIAPNPAPKGDGTVIEVAHMGTGKAALDVVDLLGRVVYT